MFWNAIVHYWTAGEWLPDYQKIPRAKVYESVNFRTLELTTPAPVRAIFTQLLAAHDSIADSDKTIIRFLLQTTKSSKLKYPAEILFLENKCLVAALLLEQGKDITHLVATSTDILRIATYLSGGDVSLATNTRFKSFPRALRRTLVKQLERVINEEDIGRHRKKWLKLFHSLHVGDYSLKVYRIALKARNNIHLTSFNGRLEYYFTRRYVDKALSLLMTRPSEFARRLDHIMRLAAELGMEKKIVDHFKTIAYKVPTRNLVQLLGHLHSRRSTADRRVVYPKGNVQKAVVIAAPLLKISAVSIERLANIITTSTVRSSHKLLIFRYQNQ